MTDKELLDGLQAASKRDTGWILRDSGHGRGMRLHETTRPKAFFDVRRAIGHGLKELKAKR